MEIEKNRITGLMLVILLAALLGACNGLGGTEAGGAAITGNVTYLPRIALAEGTTINVQLQDTSLADAPAKVMGEQVIVTTGEQVPIPYEVTYDSSEIIDNHTYTMRARIEDPSGKLIFINDTSIPVITRDNPTENVEIMVVPVN